MIESVLPYGYNADVKYHHFYYMQFSNDFQYEKIIFKHSERLFGKEIIGIEISMISIYLLKLFHI